MADVPPLRWSAPGFEGALDAAAALARAFAEHGALPEGSLERGWRILKQRPMRLVLAGPAAGPSGDVAAFAKARRPVTLLDRARRRARPPRGPAEGTVLQALASRGVPAARPLGWAADAGTGTDVLLVEAVPGARPLGEALRDDAPRRERTALAEAVGRLLRRAHDAGWRPRDLHRDNVLVGPGGLALIDAGTAPLRRAPLPPRRALLLGIAAHGLEADPRTGLLALRGYFGGDRAEARRWMPLAVEAAKSVARAYRRGRSRRAHRSGLHFEAFRPAGPATSGIRDRARTPEEWKALAAGWIEALPPGARALKADGRVAAVRLPGLAPEVAVKRFDASWKDRFRTPRALRAFRRAYALRVRGVPCPEPLLAASDARAKGVYVAALAGAPDAPAQDLDRAARGDGSRAPALSALPPAERHRALERLGRFLRRMHDAEVVHRDLKAANLVAWAAPRGPQFAVVDLEGAHVSRGPVPWARRARDLARLDASAGSPPVSRADRRRVLRGYFRAWERAPVGVGDFARRVAFSSARKRAPSGRPR